MPRTLLSFCVAVPFDYAARETCLHLLRNMLQRRRKMRRMTARRPAMRMTTGHENVHKGRDMEVVVCVRVCGCMRAKMSSKETLSRLQTLTHSLTQQKRTHNSRTDRRVLLLFRIEENAVLLLLLRGGMVPLCARLGDPSRVLAPPRCTSAAPVALLKDQAVGRVSALRPRPRGVRGASLARLRRRVDVPNCSTPCPLHVI